jgi:5-methylcytosine-specific restriction enzyme A
MTDGWTSEELAAAVEAYVHMQRQERDGEPFTKRAVYAELATRFGRTDKAFEYRMQNISFVLSLLGRDWLTGLKPARNVGARVGAEIEELLTKATGVNRIPTVAFEIETRNYAEVDGQNQPTGIAAPQKTIVEVTQYSRDASVKAWILRNAAGHCECCGAAAPFLGVDGIPFLEVHHVSHLADGGEDTVANAIAICPNCHRCLHYGVNAKDIRSGLYERIPRLKR